MKSKLAVIVLVISSMGWGLTWLPLKYLTEVGMDSLHLILIAFASGAILFSPWLFRQYPEWKGSIGLMLMIALAGGIANASFQTAIAHGDVIRVMILFYMLPVWSVIGGHFFLREKVSVVRLIAVGLSLAGAAIILDVVNTSWQGISWIDVLAILSGMGLAATNILFRHTPNIPAMSKVAAMFAGCAVLITLSLSLVGETQSLPGTQPIVLAALYGVVWLGLITYGTQWAVTRMEAGRSSIIIVMELVVAVVSSALILGSDLGTNEILGGLMVLSAAIMEGARYEDSEQTLSES